MSEARVEVDGVIQGRIRAGLLVLLGIRNDDELRNCEQLANKVIGLRIFADESGKMNRDVRDAGREILIVSQFTLYGETAKGNRPSFSRAASAEKASPLYEAFVSVCRESGLHIETGVFQAHMQVFSVNDGPVTLLCYSENN